jgi:uncharacterized membrane protein YeaQ/YmgE (transglycosylase-associated protein family)
VPLPSPLNHTLMPIRPKLLVLSPSRGHRHRSLGSSESGGMLDFLNKTFEVDTYTIVVVALLAGWSGVLTMHALSKAVMALVFVPGFVFGALVANYLFEEYGFYPTPDKSTNIVVACTLGIIAALLVLLLVTRIATTVTGLRVERHQFRRA